MSLCLQLFSNLNRTFLLPLRKYEFRPPCFEAQGVKVSCLPIKTKGCALHKLAFLFPNVILGTIPLYSSPWIFRSALPYSDLLLVLLKETCIIRLFGFSCAHFMVPFLVLVVKALFAIFTFLNIYATLNVHLGRQETKNDLLHYFA